MHTFWILAKCLLVSAGLDLARACGGGLVAGHVTLLGVNRVGILSIEVAVLGIIQSGVHLHHFQGLSITVHLHRVNPHFCRKGHAWH